MSPPDKPLRKVALPGPNQNVFFDVARMTREDGIQKVRIEYVFESAITAKLPKQGTPDSQELVSAMQAKVRAGYFRPFAEGLRGTMPNDRLGPIAATIVEWEE